MRPRYVPFYLCQRVRCLRWQQFLTLSQNKKKVVSDSPEVHLNVSKQFFFNFHFFHWFQLDLVKMAKLSCDLVCWRMRRMRQHCASVCGACGSTLLAYAAPMLANCQHMRRIRQQNRVKKSFCKRMLRMRLQIASVCGSNLLAQTAHMLANCQRMRRIRQHFASVDGACEQKGILGERVLAQTAHALALCQRMRLIQQKISSVDGAYGSDLLAYAVHAVANCQRRPRIRQQFPSVHGACGSKTV